METITLPIIWSITITNPDTIEKLNPLCELYKQSWGKDIDYTVLPTGITQKKLLNVLERIVDTSESILARYDKLFCQVKEMTFIDHRLFLKYFN